MTRVLLLTNGQSNQRALACRISEKAEIVGIVVSRNIPRKKPSLVKKGKMTVNSIAGRSVGRTLLGAWKRLLDTYSVEYPAFPTSKLIEVENVNDDATLRAIEKYTPDLVVVSGTNLVGRRVIEASQVTKGIINLHTGISPYVRGGPNCTNWCLAKGWFHLIGNTVMWLDPGIDTGNIIATEQTPLNGGEDLLGLHRKVMDHAHQLYVRAIGCFGNDVADVPCIDQSSIAEGAHFNGVDWNILEMLRAMLNFRNNYQAYFQGRAEMLETEQPTLFPIC